MPNTGNINEYFSLSPEEALAIREEALAIRDTVELEDVIEEDSTLAIAESEEEEAEEEEEEERCDVCNEELDSCECISCDRCGDRFVSGEGADCGCNYCCNHCAEREEHYHCECGEILDTDSNRCEDCGRGACCRDFSCNDMGCCRCDDCCDCSRGPIRDYSCRDYPVSVPRHPPYMPFLYMGVENEVEVLSDDDQDSVAQEIYDKHNDVILIKHDGSLDNGFELVTGKGSLEFHQEMWPKLAKTAIRAGARSWRHATTGLHVHMSRNWFSPLTLGKLLVFINSDKTRANIVKLAGRESTDYAAMKKKKLTDIAQSERRYEAVNLQNSKTIEIRIFKGTLNPTHILADIEFCHAVAMWASQVSVADCEDWDNFWSFVLQHRKDYARLIQFMAMLQERKGHFNTQERGE